MRVLRQWLTLDTTAVMLPCHSKILHVAPARTGDGRIDVWFLAPDHEESGHYINTEWRVHVAGTGHEVPEIFGDAYRGTAVMPSGLVWHVFMIDKGFLGS